jgi:hypothetical protein
MTKARNMADLLDSNGDVKSGALDNVPPADVVNDTTPQLGGNLDGQSYNITTTGNVGIGTSSPSSKLQVEGTLAVRSSSSQTFNDSVNANNLTMTDSKSHFNLDSVDKDFQVSSDSTSNMLLVDAGNNQVLVNKSVGTQYGAQMEVNGHFHADDIITTGSFFRGAVPNSTNDNSSCALLGNIDASNGGFIYNIKVTVMSWTGQGFIDIVIGKKYNSTNVYYDLVSSTDLSGYYSKVGLQLVKCTYTGTTNTDAGLINGDTYLGIKKNGGAIGTLYIDGLMNVAGNAKIHRGCYEVRSYEYTVTSTIATLL